MVGTTPAESAKHASSPWSRPTSNVQTVDSETSPRADVRDWGVPSWDVRQIREANRAVVRKGLAKEYDSLMGERNALVKKKYQSILTETEARRLAYVTWQLDAIEDAQSGYVFDELEMLAEAQERLGERIEGYLQELEGRQSGRQSRRRVPPKGKRKAEIQKESSWS